MKRDLRDDWIDALLSGNYTQARKCLHSVDGGMCCLGVLADVIDPAGWADVIETDDFSGIAHHLGDNAETLNDSTLTEVEMTKDQMLTLARKNDDGQSFEEIAEWIEANL